MTADRTGRAGNQPAECVDTLVCSVTGPERYWVGAFEDDITELGIRAAAWGVEENDGGNRADLMFEDYAELMGDPGE